MASYDPVNTLILIIGTETKGIPPTGAPKIAKDEAEMYEMAFRPDDRRNYQNDSFKAQGRQRNGTRQEGQRYYNGRNYNRPQQNDIDNWRSNRRDDRQVNLTCYNCHRKGHTQNQCKIERCMKCLSLGHNWRQCRKYDGPPIDRKCEICMGRHFGRCFEAGLE